MKQKKLTMTVGVPAYNEKANIANLLKSILSQKETNYKLEKILVISDGSSDSTEDVVKNIRNKNIQLLTNKKRIGKALTQNIILNNNKSDVLVLLEADVLPKNNHLLEGLVKPFLVHQNIGIVGGKVTPLPPTTYIENVLFFSTKLKNDIYKNINNGNNIYMCHGRVRAFSKSLAKSLRWEPTFGEDAYSYLGCISKGYSFYYSPSAEILYKLPDDVRDHVKQSSRFFSSINAMKKYYDKKLVDIEYRIPLNLLLRKYLKHFLKSPLKMIIYVMIVSTTKLMSKEEKKNLYWATSKSSKVLETFK